MNSGKNHNFDFWMLNFVLSLQKFLNSFLFFFSGQKGTSYINVFPSYKFHRYQY